MAGQRIEYVRVSTLDQNEKRQLDGQVLDRVFTDKTSARDTTRSELTELMRFARDGDTVVVHSMDRLARDLDDLRKDGAVHPRAPPACRRRLTPPLQPPPLLPRGNSLFGGLLGGLFLQCGIDDCGPGWFFDRAISGARSLCVGG